MKILIVRQSEHNEITPLSVIQRGYGATETCFIYLAKSLAKNHQVRVCCPCEDIPYLYYENMRFVKFKDFGQVQNLSKEYEPDCVIVVANPSILSKVDFKTKTVFWQHNHPLELKYPIEDLLNKGIKVVMPSPQAGEVARRHYKNDSINGIYNGVRTYIFKDTNLKREKNKIVYSGSFVRAKGLIEVLKAAQVLKDYKFYLCGGFDLYGVVDVEYRRECMNLASDNVIFKHNLAPQKLSDEINEAELCICNPIVGNKEVCCVSMLESMSCNTPCLIGHNEILEKITENRAFCFKNKLVDAIQDVFANKNKNEITKQGHDWVKSLAWEKVVLEWNSFLEK